MKKLLAIAVLLVSSVAISAEDAGFFKDGFDKEAFTKEFAEGFVAGAVATVGVDFFREYILPDVSSLCLYTKYGICRDRLAGEVSMALAVLGVSAVNEVRGKDLSYKVRAVGARLLGIIAGAAVAKVTRKKVGNLLG